jgi:uridine kinase
MDALAVVLSRVRALPGRPIIGIDGPGASGKSTLAARLAAAFGGCTVVHGDDFYHPSESRPPEDDIGVGGLFDLDRLRDQAVRPAREGRATRYQVYDWGLDRLTDWVEIPAEGPVIVEGVCCTEERLRHLYDLRLFVDADPAVRLARAMARDGEHMRRLWVDVWMPSEDRYVATQRPDLHAHVVLDGNGATIGPAVHFR